MQLDEILDASRSCECDGACGRHSARRGECGIKDGGEYVEIRGVVMPLRRWAEFFGMEAADAAESEIPLPHTPGRVMDALETDVVATCVEQARAARRVVWQAALERAHDRALVDVLARTPGSEFAEARMELAVLAPCVYAHDRSLCQWCRREWARVAMRLSGSWWLETEALDVG